MEHPICAKHDGIWYYADIRKGSLAFVKQKGEIAFKLPDGTKIAFTFPIMHGTARTRVIEDHKDMMIYDATLATNQKAAEGLYGDK